MMSSAVPRPAFYGSTVYEILNTPVVSFLSFLTPVIPRVVFVMRDGRYYRSDVSSGSWLLSVAA